MTQPEILHEHRWDRDRELPGDTVTITRAAYNTLLEIMALSKAITERLAERETSIPEITGYLSLLNYAFHTQGTVSGRFPALYIKVDEDYIPVIPFDGFPRSGVWIAHANDDEPHTRAWSSRWIGDVPEERALTLAQVQVNQDHVIGVINAYLKRASFRTQDFAEAILNAIAAPTGKEPLPLWKVERTHCGYGEYRGFIIRAATQMDARKMASAYSVDDLDWRVVEPDPIRNLWFAPETVVTPILPSTQPEVLFYAETE